MAARSPVRLLKTDSIIEELDRIRREIAARAYDYFEGRRGGGGDPMEDWARAERELVWRPAIEVSEREEQIVVEAAIAGVDPKDVDVRVTEQELLIRAELGHRHGPEKGTVHHCEFMPGPLFRSIRFPVPVNRDKVKAESEFGLLRVIAPFAERRTVPVNEGEAAKPARAARRTPRTTRGPGGRAAS